VLVGSTFLPQAKQGQDEHDNDHKADEINDTVHLRSPWKISGQHHASAPRFDNVDAVIKFP
jgi:hypothetical protein